MAHRMPLQSTIGRRLVRVVPHQLDIPPYAVTLIQAERMIAKGTGNWIVEYRSIQEVNCNPRGERRTWRKRDSGGYKVMQLVLPVATTSWSARLASK